MSSEAATKFCNMPPPPAGYEVGGCYKHGSKGWKDCATNIHQKIPKYLEDWYLDQFKKLGYPPRIGVEVTPTGHYYTHSDTSNSAWVNSTSRWVNCDIEPPCPPPAFFCPEDPNKPCTYLTDRTNWDHKIGPMEEIKVIRSDQPKPVPTSTPKPKSEPSEKTQTEENNQGKTLETLAKVQVGLQVTSAALGIANLVVNSMGLHLENQELSRLRAQNELLARLRNLHVQPNALNGPAANPAALLPLPPQVAAVPVQGGQNDPQLQAELDEVIRRYRLRAAANQPREDAVRQLPPPPPNRDQAAPASPRLNDADLNPSPRREEVAQPLQPSPRREEVAQPLQPSPRREEVAQPLQNSPRLVGQQQPLAEKPHLTQLEKEFANRITLPTYQRLLDRLPRSDHFRQQLSNIQLPLENLPRSKFIEVSRILVQAINRNFPNRKKHSKEMRRKRDLIKEQIQQILKG